VERKSESSPGLHISKEAAGSGKTVGGGAFNEKRKVRSQGGREAGLGVKMSGMTGAQEVGENRRNVTTLK